MCPRCKRRMTRRARPPLKLKLSDGLVDVSYIASGAAPKPNDRLEKRESRTTS